MIYVFLWIGFWLVVGVAVAAVVARHDDFVKTPELGMMVLVWPIVVLFGVFVAIGWLVERVSRV